MRPEPQTENQNEIATRIDYKARIIAEERGRWDTNQIRAEMSAATPHEWTDDDHVFFDQYVDWRSVNPL